VRVAVRVNVRVAVAVREGVTVAVGVRVSVGVGVAVGVRVSVGVRVAVGVNVSVGVRVGVKVGVGVRVLVAVGVGEGVMVGVSLGVSVIVGVSVGVGVQTLGGQTVGVHVGVKVHVGGTVAVREGVKVAVGVTGFNTRPTKLNEPSAMSKIKKPKPPMMANFSPPGICERPPRRRGAAFKAAPPAMAAGTDAAATCGLSTADRAVMSAAIFAASSLRRFSPSFCSSLAALEFLGLIARTCRRQSSFSASSTARVLSHSHAFSLRGSETSARLNISRAFSFWPRRASVMP
jgi:hypothetical protein